MTQKKLDKLEEWEALLDRILLKIASHKQDFLANDGRIDSKEQKKLDALALDAERARKGIVVKKKEIATKKGDPMRVKINQELAKLKKELETLVMVYGIA